MGEGLSGWFAGRIPEGWFTGPPEVRFDREEILVTGRLGGVRLPEGSSPEERASAEEARIARFREETRAARMRIADEAERRFGRKVAWGAAAGETEAVFTSLAVPVMTRLRIDERRVLDTLVEAGVARSRSDALAWCVKLVAKHESDWIADLREALVKVREVRAAGPSS